MRGDDHEELAPSEVRAGSGCGGVVGVDGL